jgi:hypothetical protein
MHSVRDAILRGRDLLEENRDWGFDRSQYLNSSEADACMRMLWYSKNQPELAASQDWGFARRGNNVERYVVESFEKMNDVAVERVGDLQVSLQDDKRRLSATPDGVISFAGRGRGWRSSRSTPAQTPAACPSPPTSRSSASLWRC